MSTLVLDDATLLRLSKLPGASDLKCLNLIRPVTESCNCPGKAGKLVIPPTQLAAAKICVVHLPPVEVDKIKKALQVERLVVYPNCPPLPQRVIL